MINDYEATEPITAGAYTDQQGLVDTDTSVNNDDTISTLNGLIEICRDGQYGFKEAAEGIERSDLKSLFYEYSQQRADFTGVLQELVRNLGGDIQEGGSFTGSLHRTWIDIKSVVMGKDEEAILNECERGEDAAKEAYTDALKSKLPSDVEDVVRQQSQAVQAAHNRIRELRNSADNDSSSSDSSRSAGSY